MSTRSKIREDVGILNIRFGSKDEFLVNRADLSLRAVYFRRCLYGKKTQKRYYHDVHDVSKTRGLLCGQRDQDIYNKWAHCRVLCRPLSDRPECKTDSPRCEDRGHPQRLKRGSEKNHRISVDRETEVDSFFLCFQRGVKDFSNYHL